MSGENAIRTELILTRATVAFLLAGVAVCTQPIVFPSAQYASRQRLVGALLTRDRQAIPLALEHRAAFQDDLLGTALAAEVAAMSSEHELAIALFRQLPRDGGGWEFRREVGWGRRLLAMSRVSEAERHLRRALQINPWDVPVNELLGNLLQNSGRAWDAAPYFFLQILRGKCRGDELLAAAGAERFFRNDERFQRIGLARTPPDPLIQVAEARRALFENRNADAERLLRECLRQRPDVGEAQGRLGRIIVDRQSMAQFREWIAGVPDDALDHPEVWYAKGMQASKLGDDSSAVHCLLHALRRSPNHTASNLQIAICLKRLRKERVAAEFSKRATLLSDLETTLNLLRSDLDQAALTKVVESLGSLGRYWEAAGWCYMMQFATPHPASADAWMRKWLQRAHLSVEQNDPRLLPSRLLRLEDYPAPDWPSTTHNPSPFVASSLGTPPSWSLTDEAQRVGIDFRYFEGSSEVTRLQHIFNVMGGGLGVIDFDMDGWPDLAIAQGNDWRAEFARSEYTDKLFRNLGGTHFADVTVPARFGHTDFSHGVTVGDFDLDGFPDVYVSNKGQNRLYHNCGDGTFEDVTLFAGVEGDAEDWSTSSVIADFTKDGLPDLYVLNYTLVSPTTEKLCRATDGSPKACTPDVLPACPDRCYVNAGDGTFYDVSRESGILDLAGRGMGVVAWPFGENGRIGLFIANDTTANFLLVNHGLNSQGAPTFHEEALLRGIALDGDGNAQACMGVAAGDIDGDARIDLFVTNFFADSNTYYAQRPGGFFEDRTRPLNLRDGSFWMNGFGCQFADLDGDGWLDLFISNGHVDQVSSRGDPDRMPAQVYRNLAGRKFEEVEAEELGDFFRQTYLGRGAAIVDWNRDGSIDIAISHLHAPLALLTNRSRVAERTQPLRLRLISKTGRSDCTGAMVTVRAGDHSQVRLVTAGDGFLVTNDQTLSVRVPGVQARVDVDIVWADGEMESWSSLEVGYEYIIPQGRRPMPFHKIAATK
jgi:tetratricopeptide (TPR) repeat protein